MGSRQNKPSEGRGGLKKERVLFITESDSRMEEPRADVEMCEEIRVTAAPRRESGEWRQELRGRHTH